MTKTASGTDRFRPLPPQAKRLHAQSGRSRDAGTVSRELFLSRKQTQRRNEITYFTISDWFSLAFSRVFFSAKCTSIRRVRASKSHAENDLARRSAHMCSGSSLPDPSRSARGPNPNATRNWRLIGRPLFPSEAWNHQRAVNGPADRPRQPQRQTRRRKHRGSRA